MMTLDSLESIACSLVQPGKGILAADESFRTIKKRFDAINVVSTVENRRAYRELLFTTPGIGEFISGVIMFDETIHQSTADEVPFTQVLMNQGILPGIKVDAGTKDLPGFPGETITEGLDGLRERLVDYQAIGARFTKWRAVIHIDDSLPTQYGMDANADALARFAAISQEVGLVPIVEPEVLMDGAHSQERCETVTEATLNRVFDALYRARVQLEGMILKPNMVVPGKQAPVQAAPEQVAEATLRCLCRSVPAAVPGITFLSGGQSPEEATENLNAMNNLGGNPWQLSFSFGRALQEPVLKTWRGNPGSVQAAQQAFYDLCRNNSLARYGKYAEKAV